MKKSIYFFSMLLILLFGINSCKTDDSVKLRKAWLENKPEEIQNYLNYINKLPIDLFYKKLMYLNNATNFSYGVIDIKDEKKWDIDTKKNAKRNIILVYETYLHSCLFYKKNISDGLRDSIHYFIQNIKINKFYDTTFSQNDINDFKQAFKEFCKNKYR